MLLASLIIGPLLTAGFAMMVRELVKAPVGCQDEHGFHRSTTDQKSGVGRAKTRRVSRQLADRPVLTGYRAAHAK